MYSLAPEKTLRLVYGPFYLAIRVTFYKFIIVVIFSLKILNVIGNLHFSWCYLIFAH